MLSKSHSFNLAPFNSETLLADSSSPSIHLFLDYIYCKECIFSILYILNNLHQYTSVIHILLGIKKSEAVKLKLEMQSIPTPRVYFHGFKHTVYFTKAVDLKVRIFMVQHKHLMLQKNQILLFKNTNIFHLPEQYEILPHLKYGLDIIKMTRKKPIK